MLRKSSPTLLCFLLLVGCMTIRMGPEVDPAVFQHFVPGSTTTAEVIAAAGQPWLRQMQPDGSETWIYLWARTKAIGIPVPFYTHVDTRGTTTTATLTFQNGVLTLAPPRQ